MPAMLPSGLWPPQPIESISSGSIGTRVVVLDAEGKVIAANHYLGRISQGSRGRSRSLTQKSTYFELAVSLGEFGILTEAPLKAFAPSLKGQPDHLNWNIP